MVLRILPAALIATLLVALACGSEPASQPDEATKSAPKVEPTPTVFERLLAFVPDTPDNRRLVRMNDIRGAAAAQGIPIPGFDATPEEMTQFKFDVAFGTERPATMVTQLGESWISGFNQEYIDVSGGTKMSLGFDARDIEAFALLGEANNPPKPIKEILIGAFEAEEAPLLLAACEKCPPHIIENYRDRTFSPGVRLINKTLETTGKRLLRSIISEGPVTSSSPPIMYSEYSSTPILNS